jgi:hypothetical protein
MQVITNTVLNTIAASAADIVLNNHQLSVTGTPTMDFRKIEEVNTLPALNELLAIATVTPTAADSTVFTINIRQYVGGKLVVVPISYTTAATGDTATTICNAYRAMINANAIAAGGQLQVTTSGTATLIITALTGSPLLTVTSGAGTNAVAYTVSGKTAFTGGTSVAATGVFTKASHGLAVGDTISITASTSSTYSLYGSTVTVPFSVVVNTVPSSSTFTVRGLTITTDGTGIGATAVAQPAQGTGASLITAGVTDAVSGTNYYLYKFTYGDNNKLKGGNVGEDHPKQVNLYVSQSATNFAAFDAQMILTQAAVTSGTTANAETVALA